MYHKHIYLVCSCPSDPVIPNDIHEIQQQLTMIVFYARKLSLFSEKKCCTISRVFFTKLRVFVDFLFYR
jgi:hypothetical protein